MPQEHDGPPHAATPAPRRASWASARGDGAGPRVSTGPNQALEATGHSAHCVAGAGLYPVARASAWALGALNLSCTFIWENYSITFSMINCALLFEQIGVCPRAYQG